jgi:uncharacterized membrane protein
MVQVTVNPPSDSSIEVISPYVTTVSPGNTGALNLTLSLPPECHVPENSFASISVTSARLSIPWAIRVPN